MPRCLRVVLLLALAAACGRAQEPGRGEILVATDLRVSLFDAVEGFRFVSAVAADPVDLSGGGESVDIWFQIDVGRAQRLADAGRVCTLDGGLLDPASAFLTADDATWCGRFASSWVFAYARDAARAPESRDELLEPGLELTMPDPHTAPDLFAGWMVLESRRHADRNGALGWFARLDARVKRYAMSIEELVEVAGQVPATGGVIVMPIECAFALEEPRVAWQAPSGELPARVFCEALRSPALEGALRELRAAAVVGLLEAGLLPAPNPELDERLNAESRGIRDRLLVHPAAGEEHLAEWMARFDNEVRSRGKLVESAGEVIDWVFAGIFVAFLIFVGRRLSRET